MTVHTQGCEARCYGDQIACGRCGTTWDHNDPEPPACKPHAMQHARSKVNHRVVFLEGGEKGSLGAPMTLPDALPAPILAAMERSHAVGGMQAAYRVFMDMVWV